MKIESLNGEAEIDEDTVSGGKCILSVHGVECRIILL